MRSAENSHSMCNGKLSLWRPNRATSTMRFKNFGPWLQSFLYQQWEQNAAASPGERITTTSHPLCSAVPPESWTSASTAVPHISSSSNSQKGGETATVSRCAKKLSPWGQDCPWLPTAPQRKEHLHGGVISCCPVTGKGSQSWGSISRAKQRCRPSTMSNAWFLRLPRKVLGCQGIWLRIFRVQYSSARSQLSNYINVPIC